MRECSRIQTKISYTQHVSHYHLVKLLLYVSSPLPFSSSLFSFSRLCLPTFTLSISSLSHHFSFCSFFLFSFCLFSVLLLSFFSLSTLSHQIFTFLCRCHFSTLLFFVSWSSSYLFFSLPLSVPLSIYLSIYNHASMSYA